ncbi:hypothetical protein DRE_02686 [Drechslerella stenobrocha 248]|uniref:CCD97-like C-terminal domain-containing protein n=1 Tax=Drechslerella stenobrocha 248 TaxID=1043628 RepID=W7I7M2_9PEZI|nr:hypothetical protein DRE_02686 [Drechslerella stenobrocha 248]
MAIEAYSSPQPLNEPCSPKDEPTRPPTVPKNPEIATRNRRLIYLQTHNEYFTLTDHAFSLPTLYSQLVSRFMTGSDRRDHASDPASQSKFSEILARDLERGEDRLEQMRRQREIDGDDEDEDDMDIEEVEDENGDIIRKHKRSRDATREEDEGAEDTTDAEPLDADILLQADANGEFSDIQDGEEAWGIWQEILSRRFLRGDDEDFDYDSVDRPGGAGDPHHLIEVEIERDEWEEYFDEEEADAYVEKDGKMYLGGKVMEGETGVQDF